MMRHIICPAYQKVDSYESFYKVLVEGFGK